MTLDNFTEEVNSWVLSVSIPLSAQCSVPLVGSGPEGENAAPPPHQAPPLQSRHDEE